MVYNSLCNIHCIFGDQLVGLLFLIKVYEHFYGALTFFYENLSKDDSHANVPKFNEKIQMFVPSRAGNA